jgi:hypothetical protein
MESIFMKTFGGLSVFGGLFTLLSYLSFPSYRSPSQVYALWLAVAAIGYGIIPFFSFVYSDPLICKIVGFLDNYFYLTALFTTAVIANCMRQIFLLEPSHSSAISSSSSPRSSLKLALQPKNYLFVWLLPFCLNLLPLLTNHFGRVENGGSHLCWIETESKSKRRNNLGLIWMGVTMYIPLLLCFLFNAYVYIAIWQRVKTWKVCLSPLPLSPLHLSLTVLPSLAHVPQIISPEISLKLGIAINRIAWYPVILVLVYIFPVIYRFVFVSHSLSLSLS